MRQAYPGLGTARSSSAGHGCGLPPASEVLDELLTQLMVFVRLPDWEGRSLDLREALGRRSVPPDDVAENLWRRWSSKIALSITNYTFGRRTGEISSFFYYNRVRVHRRA